MEGLRSRANDPGFMNCIAQFPVLCFQETWLAPGEKVTIPGYVSYFKNKFRVAAYGPTPGGIAIYVAEKFASQISEVTDIENENAIWLVGKIRSVTYCIGNVYNFPEGSRNRDPNFFDDLSDNVNLLAHFAALSEYQEDEIDLREYDPAPIDILHPLFIPRSSRDQTVNSNGRKLLSFCRQNDLFLMNGRSSDSSGEFTYMSTTGCSVVDYALVSGELVTNPNVSFEVSHTMLTKHNPILVSIPLGDPLARNRQNVVHQTLPLQERLVVDKERMVDLAGLFNTEFDSYRDVLEEELAVGDGEKVAKMLVGAIRHIGQKFIRKNKKRKGPYWFNKECNNLKSRGRIALAGFRKTRLPIPLTRYVKAKSAYRKAIKKAKKQYRLDSQEKMKKAVQQGKPNEIWKLLKQQIRRKDLGATSRISPSQWIDHFDKTLNHKCLDNPEWTVNTTTLPEVDELDRPISPQEVLNSINRFKSAKAPGKDGVGGDVLKSIAQTITPLLTKFYNHILCSGEYPSFWTSAILCPIYKGAGSSSLPDNYRGIALLPHLGKVLCRIIKDRMETWIDRRNLISQNQGGFRKGRMTTDNALITDTLIQNALHKRNGRLYIAAVDLKKAFDFTPRKALLYRLAQLGISKKMFCVLNSMFSNSTYAVKVDQISSTQFVRSTSGIFQGCVCSPQLFVLFLEAITDDLKEIDSYSPVMAGKIIQHLLWADDLELISCTVLGLQRLLNALHTFCLKWGLEVNSNKTKILVIKKGRKLSGAEKWYYNGNRLQVVPIVRYLGFFFSFNGQWSQHKKLAIEKALKALYPLISFFYKNKDLPASFFKHLYLSMVEPIILCGAELWSVYLPAGLNDSYFNQLHKPMLRFVKTVLGLPRGAPTAGVLMEMGLTRTFGRALCRAMNYWLRIIQLPEGHIMKLCLAEQRRMIEKGAKPWLFHIRRILRSFGFSVVWENGGPGNFRHFQAMFKQRVLDI